MTEKQRYLIYDEAVDLTEEQYQYVADVVNYGVGFSVDGKRIAPEDVYMTGHRLNVRRKSWEGDRVTVFLVEGGKELRYTAKVPRWTDDDSLCVNEDGSVLGRIQMNVNGRKRDISGTLHRVGERWQFVKKHSDVSEPSLT